MISQLILVSAYGCEPNKGSEQGVGWNWVLQLARYNELIVLTRSNNKESIEAALPGKLKNRICFVYYDLPPKIKYFKRKEKGLYLYYLLWQWGAYKKALDIVQHKPSLEFVISLTFGSIWMPTFMHRLPLKFIWGPIGGGESIPFPLLHDLPLKTRVTQYIRYLLIASIRLNPLIIGPLKKSKLLLVRTNNTAEVIPEKFIEKVHVVLETAVSEHLHLRSMYLKASSNEVLRVIYTGRLISIKNIATAIEAVSRAITSGIEMEFIIVGDGPEKTNLEALVSELNLTSSVHFRGVVPQSQVMEELNDSDIFLFPSLKEGGVWALMEAMSVGLPVICIDTSGMSVITDNESAIRVLPTSKEDVIRGFADALGKLAKSPSLRGKMGEKARERIKTHFSWDSKGDDLQKLLIHL